MSGTIQRRLAALEAAYRPSRSCWIGAIQSGETAAEAMHRHARDPELAGRAFVLLPVKRGEVPA